jgi:hypothetical protein
MFSESPPGRIWRTALRYVSIQAAGRRAIQRASASPDCRARQCAARPHDGIEHAVSSYQIHGNYDNMVVNPLFY